MRRTPWTGFPLLLLWLVACTGATSPPEAADTRDIPAGTYTYETDGTTRELIYVDRQQWMQSEDREAGLPLTARIGDTTYDVVLEDRLVLVSKEAQDGTVWTLV